MSIYLGGSKLARRRGRKGRKGAAFTIDLTEAKFFGMLFRDYNGPGALKKLMAKDISGAADEWGKGDYMDVGIKATTAGFWAMLKRKTKMYVQPIKSRFLGLKG